MLRASEEGPGAEELEDASEEYRKRVADNLVDIIGDGEHEEGPGFSYIYALLEYLTLRR